MHAVYCAAAHMGGFCPPLRRSPCRAQSRPNAAPYIAPRVALSLATYNALCVAPYITPIAPWITRYLGDHLMTLRNFRKASELFGVFRSFR